MGIPHSLLIQKDPFGAKHRHAMQYYIGTKIIANCLSTQNLRIKISLHK